ncbi:16S rRNA (adenine(1518)-N(6)/adenine(1519)-N(6))-dimethyltransferase RsmA [Georgenia yuyongxinii]|uniref:Ribosomal RNA small subunit methyltransferase A n=1 Tax=Georgenia yuyongxinii TaxID=2589797 RepID=A0A552WV83_9MICO|nr:16S rRNA (adenine(1518)-N(6)/adenine(1519)-N(6))-dimethyltransferase RsmA [Georgenia yuyongxinii]
MRSGPHPDHSRRSTRVRTRLPRPLARCQPSTRGRWPPPPPVRLGAVTTDATPPAGLLGAADVRRLADALGVRPTKTLGQNFVHDAGTVRRIVRTAGVEAGDVVLEVGPGLGSLTLALLETGAHVVAVEIDPPLARALPATVTARMPDAAARLAVLPADAMTVTGPADLPAPAALAGDAVVPTRLVANLPYNVAVPVLLTLLQNLPSLAEVLVMVQAEVADRIAAPPGSRTYGVPSVKAAWYAEATRAGTISRSVFWPVPNVDSALVRLRRREPPATTATRREVFAVVDAAFAQRRKTLRAALGPWAGSPAAAEVALRAAGVDPTLRGERLTVTDFARIAEQRPAGAGTTPSGTLAR